MTVGASEVCGSASRHQSVLERAGDVDRHLGGLAQRRFIRRDDVDV